MAKFESDKWIRPIMSTCMDFLKKMRDYPGGKFLGFRDDLGTEEHPGKIVQEYHSTASILNSCGYKVETRNNVINKYLFMALYVRAFLNHKPFYLDAPGSSKLFTSCKYTDSPNEYFIIPFIEAFFREWDNDYDGQLRLDDKARNEFIRTLSKYKNDISLLNPISFSEKLYTIKQKYFYKSS